MWVSNIFTVSTPRQTTLKHVLIPQINILCMNLLTTRFDSCEEYARFLSKNEKQEVMLLLLCSCQAHSHAPARYCVVFVHAELKQPINTDCDEISKSVFNSLHNPTTSTSKI